MKIKAIRYIAALLIFAILPVLAQNPVTAEDNDDEEGVEVSEDAVDEDDRYIREHPIIEYDDEIDIPIPSWVNIDANHIILNGADWNGLRRAFQNTTQGTVSIVHIGDSHIQADIGTGTTRDLLQYDYGDAGRGLITPLKLSGTNEPIDYAFTSSRGWDAVKLMKTPWKRTMGFTGCSITPSNKESNFTVATSTKDDYDPFSSFIIFHKGRLSITGLTDGDGKPIAYQAIPSRDYTQVVMDRPVVKATVNFQSSGDLTLFGVSLSGNRPGVFYHAIGNNGATYDTYNRIGNVGAGIAPLHPNLVIISLGANEAFGRLDTQSFYRSIDKLVKNIRSANPDAQILLTTPMECHKSVYTTTTKTVKAKGKKGRRGSKRNRRTRQVKTKVKSYAVNSNILPLRNEILRYGRENGIAVYDWYEVAGGAGASNTWISNGYYSNDRVHHTAKGYHLMGRMLYEALTHELLKKPQ